jgi:hypothetical protein
MPHIIYGGLKYKQVRHAIYCRRCQDTIESYYIHDHKYCLCGAVGIDGGIEDGNSILGNFSLMEDRSMYCATIKENNYKLWLPEEIIYDNFLKFIKIGKLRIKHLI